MKTQNAGVTRLHREIFQEGEVGDVFDISVKVKLNVAAKIRVDMCNLEPFVELSDSYEKTVRFEIKEVNEDNGSNQFIISVSIEKLASNTVCELCDVTIEKIEGST